METGFIESVTQISFGLFFIFLFFIFENHYFRFYFPFLLNMATWQLLSILFFLFSDYLLCWMLLLGRTTFSSHVRLVWITSVINKELDLLNKTKIKTNNDTNNKAVTCADLCPSGEIWRTSSNFSWHVDLCRHGNLCRMMQAKPRDTIPKIDSMPGEARLHDY